MEAKLLALIFTSTELKSLVAKRVNWVVRPEKNKRLPAIVLRRVSEVNSFTSTGVDTLVLTRIQADVYSDTYKTAINTARVLKRFLNNHSDYRDGGVFQRIKSENERDLTETEAQSRQLFRISIDFQIWHVEGT